MHLFARPLILHRLRVSRSAYLASRPDGPHTPPLQPLAVAKLFKEVVTKEEPGLVLLGKQSIDGDCAQTGPMLAALLGWPQATFACKVWRRPPPFSRPQRRF